jgi:hypothetical protein
MDVTEALKDPRFDITGDYVNGAADFNDAAFAEEIKLLKENGKTGLAALAEEENAPILAEGDEMVKQDEVESIRLSDKPGVDNTFVITLKAKDPETGENKKIIVSKELNEQGFYDAVNIATAIYNQSGTHNISEENGGDPLNP